MGDLTPVQQRAAQAFFGYFPTWKMFSMDIGTSRDERSREEGFVRLALDYLADITGRTHSDLLGLYFSTQSGSSTSQFAKDELLRCYDTAYQAHFGRPSGAFPDA